MITVLAGYIFAAIFATYPLIFKLGTHLPGQPGDAYSYLWNIWIFQHQLLNGQNLFYTDMIMAPIGANLYFNTYAPLVSVFGLLFKNNLSSYLGVLIILSIIASSFFMYLLSYKITKNRMASFLGGLIYGMAPIIQSFIQSQHYYFLFASPFFPLAVLFLVNFFEKRELKQLYLSIAFFWPVLSIDYYSSILYALLIILFIILNEKEIFKNFVNYLIAGLVIIVVPFLALTLIDPNLNEFVRHTQESNTSNSCNTNLTDFFIPDRNSVFLSKYSYDLRNITKTQINYDTPSYFLGWGIFIVALISMITNRRAKFVFSFSVIFIFFLSISLGTNIKVGDFSILSGKATPFYYFIQIPILSMLGCTIRFPIIMQMCIAILISIYISKNKKLTRVTIAILILIIVEYSTRNIDFSVINVPAIYSRIASEENKRTVLEMPSGITESIGAFGYDWSIQALHSQQMYWQTEYQKPRVGAYISRLTPDKYAFFRNEPVISEIFEFTSLGGTRPLSDIPEEDIKMFINKFKLGYIVLSPNNRQREFSDFVENEFGNYIKSKVDIDGYILYILLDTHS